LRRAGFGPAASADERSWIDGVAVLPFRNLSGESQEFFADGMTEAVIWDLAKLRSLRVISRTSAMRYKRSDKALPEIARELNIGAVIEGSVSCEHGRVFVRVQLVRADTDSTIWAASYERDLKDVLILQSEIALAIARAIRVVVTADENRQLTADARVVDPGAYESYLKGQFHWGKLTPPDLDAALGYFERARDKEPVLADVGIAAVWLARQQMNLVPPAVAGPRAKAAALRALAGGDLLPEAHYINALVSWSVDWDWSASRSAFQRAFELRANYAEARAYHSHFLTILGRPQDGIAEMRRALDSDPHNALFRCLYGIVLVFARQYDAAIEELRAALRVVPMNAVINRGLMCAFHMKGMPDATVAQTRAWFTALNDRQALDALERTSGTASLYEVAGILASRGRAGYYATSDIATMYICAGRPDKALDWFEAGLERRDPDMPYIRNPICDVVRQEPRYQRVVETMNFPP
jgi:TolB-like protein/tetratricopeptide (TPR) repeat protein